MSRGSRYDGRSFCFGAPDDARTPSPEVNRYVRGLAPHCGGVVGDEVHHDPAPYGLNDADDDVSHP